MKEIKIFSRKYPGYVALVDDEDFEELNKYKWNLNKDTYTCYAIRWDKNLGRQVKMHRQIMGVTDPKIHVDHRDRDGLHCQRNNLRIATRSQNQMNRKRNPKSNFPGVFWDKERSKWRVEVKCNGKIVFAKRFDDELTAAIIRDSAVKQYHGEFARLNFPD